MKKLIASILVLIGFQVAMFLAAVQENFKIASGPYAHFIAFFFLALILLTILMHRHVRVKYPYVVVLLYTLLVAWVIELIQKSLPYRTSSFDDILWGLSGAIACILLVEIVHKKFNLWL